MVAVAKLIYTINTSLDGYFEDQSGGFDWGVPDEAVHAFINDLERPVGTYLYGRRMYEVMRVWQDLPLGGVPPYIRDYAQVWRAAEKIVYSRTLESAETPRTSLRREFEPDAVRALLAGSATDVSIGGPTIAARALSAGLLGECRVFVHPVVVGGGTRFLPDGPQWPLALLDQHSFDSGIVYLRYGLRDPQ